MPEVLTAEACDPGHLTFASIASPRKVTFQISGCDEQ